MPLPAIVAVTPGDARDLRPWIATLGGAGLPGVLVREPARSVEEVRVIVAWAVAHVPTVWLHQRTPHDADLLDAVDGVHLPDAPLEALREPWGRSCHSPEAVRAAWASGASWAFLSPIHPPTSKADDRPTLGSEVFRRLGGPVYALGGMTPDRHREAVAAGALGSAVLGDLFGQPSPAAAAERLTAWLPSTAR